MKLSIITTIYKAEKDLPTLLDSMIAMKSSNLEFFMIDNGSPDRCGEILKKYAEKDSRIKILTLKNNIGYIKARNLGLDMVDADYVGFCDSDDYLEVGGYDIAIDELLMTEADCYIGCYKEHSKTRERVMEPPYKFGYYEYDDIKQKILPQCFGEYNSKESLRGFVWKQIYSKRIIDSKKIRFLLGIQPYEDEIFNIDIIKSCKNLIISSNILYNYNVNYNSITSKMFKSFNLQDEWSRIVNCFKLRIEKCENDVERSASCISLIRKIYICVLWTAKTSISLKNSSKILKRLCFEDIDILLYIYSSNLNMNFQDKWIKWCLLNKKQHLLLSTIKFYIRYIKE